MSIWDENAIVKNFNSLQQILHPNCESVVKIVDVGEHYMPCIIHMHSMSTSNYRNPQILPKSPYFYRNHPRYYRNHHQIFLNSFQKERYNIVLVLYDGFIQISLCMCTVGMIYMKILKKGGPEFECLCIGQGQYIYVLAFVYSIDNSQYFDNILFFRISSRHVHLFHIQSIH